MSALCHSLCLLQHQTPRGVEIRAEGLVTWSQKFYPGEERFCTPLETKHHHLVPELIPFKYQQANQTQSCVSRKQLSVLNFKRSCSSDLQPLTSDPFILPDGGVLC